MTFGKEEVQTATEPITETDTKDRGRDEQDGPKSRDLSPGETGLILLVAIGVFATGIRMLAKWARWR
jgi:hypothetical protein